jgi:hypothetical protein
MYDLIEPDVLHTASATALLAAVGCRRLLLMGAVRSVTVDDCRVDPTTTLYAAL